MFNAIKKQKTRSSVLLGGCLLFLATACSNSMVKYDSETAGAIYGNLRIKLSFPEQGTVSPTQATVFVQGTDLTAKPDSAGIFYFPGIDPGKYALVGKATGFTDFILENVDVAADSISIATMATLLRGQIPIKQTWKGIKIEKVDINNTGEMAGQIIDSGSGEKINGAVSIIKGTFWGAVIDSTGRYIITNILPGRYTAVGYERDFHQTKIYDIEIVPDTTSLVDFRLRPIGIPEEPLPRKWIKKFK